MKEDEKPKDATKQALNEGDMVETISDLPISGTTYTIPKGTKLGRIRFWYDKERVEVNRVIVQGSELDLIVRTEFLRKITQNPG